MAPSKKSGVAASDSDMDLSSGSDNGSVRSVGLANIADSPERDVMQRGVDFIGFELSDDEAEAEIYDYIPRQQQTDAKKTLSKKRARSVDSDDDDGPSSGPPPGCPWMGHRKYSKMSSVPMMLTQELKDFVDYISPTREEHQVRKYVFQVIKNRIAQVWKDVEVVVFGSYETKLYLPSSDMDIVILRNQAFQVPDLRKLGNHLRNSGDVTDITVISKARVPIIKCKERITGIAVDISFNATNGIQSAAVVTEFVSEMPALRPLTMLIKHFLMLKNHNEVFMGGLGSYTTLIMILSFLQMHPQIQTRKIKAEDNLGVLLIEFFELYGLCFNYTKVGLSVIDGGSYFAKPAPKTGRPAYGRAGPEMLLTCIDPNDRDNDTARSSFNLRKIREVFVGAYGTLTSAVQRRHRELFGKGDSSRSGRETHVRFDEHNKVPVDSTRKSSGLHHSTQVSLIRDVLHVPREVMEHRRRVEGVFYGGVFQRMFKDPEGIQGLDKMEGKERQTGADALSSIEVLELSTDGEREKSESNNNRNNKDKGKDKDKDKGKNKGKGKAVQDDQEEEENQGLHDSTAEELELAIFLEAEPAHNVEEDDAISTMSVGPILQFRELSSDDKAGLQEFAALRHEINHRMTFKMIDQVEKKVGRTLTLAERSDTFRKARQAFMIRLEKDDAKKASKVGNIPFDRKQIVDAVKNCSRVLCVGPGDKKSTRGASSNSVNERREAGELRDVEFVTVEDSEDSEDEYFDQLMKQGAEEYGEDGDDAATTPGHRDPNNVNASGNSIQLPQLISAPRDGNRNSSRNEQLAD